MYSYIYNLQFISVFQEYEYDGPIATGHSISLMLDLELSLHHSQSQFQGELLSAGVAL